MTDTSKTITSMVVIDLAKEMELSKTLALSALLPEHLRKKPEDVLVTILTGRELGMSPLQAIRSIYVVNGRPTLSADSMVAMCLRHSDVCEYFRLVESNANIATYETKRRGSEPVRLSYTMDEAKGAGLTGKDTWRKHPAAMLRARAASALARATYPDLVGGLYDTDEGEEIRASARLQQVQRRVDVEAKPAPVNVIEGEVVKPNDIDVIKALRERIQAANNNQELTALVPEISAQPDAAKNELRGLYMERSKAVRGGA